MSEFTDFEVQVDLTDVKEWDGEQRPLVPAGDYKVTVIDVKSDNAKSSGNPVIKVEFEIDEGEYQGQKLFNTYSLSEKALGRIKALMVACGASLDKIRASELLGQSIEVTVTHEETQSPPDANGNPQPSKTFSRVMKERPIGGDAQPEPETKPAAKPPVTRGTQQQRTSGARRA